MTISGQLEPSSIVTRFRPASLTIFSPTSRLPVKLIFRTRGSVQSFSPSALPPPVRQEMANGGRPASSRISTSFERDQRRIAGGLENNRIAGGERRADFVAREIQRKVKRRDGDDHAAGDAEREGELAGAVAGAVDRQDFAAEAFGFFGGELDGFGGAGDFGRRFADRFAFFERESAGQIGLPIAHQARCLREGLKSLVGGHGAH